VRILLVEDEPDLGAALKRALTQAAYVVDWVQEGWEATRYLDAFLDGPGDLGSIPYTVMVLDWLLPGRSGLELCHYLRSCQSTLPVLMLTAKDRIEDRVQGLDAGADDYLIKPFGMAELLARVRALQRRSPQLQLPQLQVGSWSLDYGSRHLQIQGASGMVQVLDLTPKEFQLLEYFMRHPQQVVTRDQVLSQLWEVGAEPSSNVVAAQMRLLRRKLGHYGYDRALETVYGLGYRLRLAPDGP